MSVPTENHNNDETSERPGIPAKDSGQDESVPFPIVGIGASAGGLIAFSRLLKALPQKTGMAFVLVQHLDPEHDSMLTELLARDTKIPVTQVEDGMRVEPDRIYIIPPNAIMALYHGRLNLLERGPGLNLPIDYFFHSLAQEQREKAMGVVLSGSGTDGSRGLKEIKTENGVTFAQDIESADYGGMPTAAVTAGAVDFVMPPEEIAEMLVKISLHPFVGKEVAQTSPVGNERDEGLLTKIFIVLRARTGADFALYKRSTLQRRIARRMVILKIEKLEDYVSLLESNPDEADKLFQDILIHVTSFFREPAVFDLLKTKVFPSIIKQKSPGTAVRIWVPGCATGEEAYSVAIAFSELSESLSPRPEAQIFATDLNEKAVERARNGVYAEDTIVEVSEERLRKYFTRVEHGYQVNQFIREMCIFAKHDIIINPPFSHIDLISFRNVLIYMERTLQNKVFPILSYSLEPWGFLLLGSSEHVSDSPELFRVVDKKHRLFTKNPAAMRQPLAVTSPAYPREEGAVNTAGFGKAKARPAFDPQNEASNILLAKYAPPGVLVNDEMQVVQFRGETGRFLTPAPGRASFDLLAMAREGLGLEIRTAVDLAKKSGEPVTREGIKVRLYDEMTDVMLEVIPFKSPINESYYQILFEETSKTAAPRSEKRKSRKAPQEKDEETNLLRRELDSTKQYLLSMIEEKEEVNEQLRAASEEVQSSNEELLSINEEMETAKEELQSANEELTTLNEELQNRNLELDQINDDLVNVQNSIGVPIILLTNDLKIRRVTPAAGRILNISAADIGRSIGDITLFIDSPDLKELAAEVIRTVNPVEREVRTGSGLWISLMIRPYVTSGNRIDGVVLTCEDISDLKLNLDMSNIFLEASKILAETLDMDKLLVSLLKVIDKAVTGCRLIINLIDLEKGEMEAIAGLGSPVFLHRKVKLEDIAPAPQFHIHREPVLVDYESVEVTPAARRFLTESDSRVVLYVPMLAHNQIIGVLSVDVPGERREFSKRERELLTGISSSAAIAVENASLFGSNKHIATVLQEALLAKPQDLPGVEFDYIYRSATDAARVGGDFYDLFKIDDRHVGIIIGDVVGKGVQAATLAARTNSIAKAYAYEHSRPELVLKKTNDVLAGTGDGTTFVTLFFGAIDLESGTLRYCNGGHPPALISRKNSGIDKLLTGSPIVGGFADAEFTGGEASLGRNDLLVLFTDGVTEARKGKDIFGLPRLIEIVTTPRFGTPNSPEEQTQKILARIDEFTGGEFSDDIAILAVRLT